MLDLFPSNPVLPRVPLPLLQGQWRLPRTMPSFEAIGSGGVSRAAARRDGGRASDDESMPLVAMPGDAARPAGLADTLVRADRWTTHDPRAALLAGPARTSRTLVVNLLDPEPEPALQLLWGLTNLESVGVAVDALREEFAIERVVVTAYLSIAETFAVRLRDFAHGRRARLTLVPPRYPIADARVLARQFATRRRTATVLDAVVLNEVGHALRTGSRPTLVPVALHEPTTRTTLHRLVERGTAVGPMLDRSDIAPHDACIRAGAAMRDVRVDRDFVIDCGELTFHVHPPAAMAPASPCVRCGWCAEVCPARLAPALLFEASVHADAPRLRREHVDACVDCGLCTAVCPSRLPLHHVFSPVRRPTTGEVLL